MEFLSDASSAPVLVIFILSSLWVYVKVLVGHWDIKLFPIEYREFVSHRRWHRLAYFTLGHGNAWHLLLNLTALWSLRFIEKLYGSMFMFKYTIVLALFEALSTIGGLHWILNFSGLQFSPQHPINNISMCGFTSVMLGWLGYISIDLAVNNKNMMFYVFGVLPVTVPIAPIILMLVSQCILPRGQNISHAGGLAGGYLLASGLLRVLPNNYWTACFFIDFTVIMCYSMVESTHDRSFSQNTDSETLDVVSYGEPVATNEVDLESGPVAGESDLEYDPLLNRDIENHNRLRRPVVESIV